MATRKAQSKASSNDNNMGWLKWVYVLGVLVAGVTTAVGFSNDILTWVLILAGLVAGFWYFDSADVEHFGLRYLILLAVVAAAPLATVPAVGNYIQGFFAGFAWFLGPVVLAQVIMFFYNKYFGDMM